MKRLRNYQFFSLNRALHEAIRRFMRVTTETKSSTISSVELLQERSGNHCRIGKAISLTYFCVFARAVHACGCVRVVVFGVAAWPLLRSCGRCSLTNPACNAQPYCHLRPLDRPFFFSILSQTARLSKTNH